MSRLLCRGLLWLASLLMMMSVVVTVGCDDTPDPALERERLVAAIDDFYQAIDNNDKEARAAMFTQDAMMLPNGWEMTRGADRIRQMVMGGGDTMVFAITDREQVEMDFSGDIGYTINRYSWSWHHRDSTPVWHPTKNIHIWRRQSDGTWKLHADIWNASTNDQ